MSDFLARAWLGLPGLACWLWGLHLCVTQHRRNRRLGIDSFTEVLYILGLDDRLERRLWAHGRRVAEIVDLQAERQRVGQTLAAAVGAGGGPPTRRGPGAAPRDGKAGPESREDVLLSTTRDIS